MNILWLSHLIPYPPKTGALSRSCNLLRELCKYHTVDVIAFKQTALIAPFYASESEGVLDAETHLKEYCQYFSYIDIPYEKQRLGKQWLAFKSLFTKSPYTINWLDAKAMHDAIALRLQEKKYDAVHLDTISLLPYVNHLGDIPYTLTHHNIESHMLLRRANKQKNLLKKLYFWQEGKRLERLEKTTCEKTSINIVCSDLDEDRLLSINHSCKTATIPNGVDTQSFTPDIHLQENDHLVFCGVMDFYPNTEAMMFFVQQVWPKLKQLRPKVKMDIIGKQPPVELIEAVDATNDITLQGFVDELAPFINRAAVFVCPIMDGGGTKLKMLDAMAMQKAIVCHPVAAEGLNITDSVHALFASTPDEFIQQIVKLLDNKTLRLYLGENGRAHVQQHFTYTALGEQLSKVYNKLQSPN